MKGCYNIFIFSAAVAAGITLTDTFTAGNHTCITSRLPAFAPCTFFLCMSYSIFIFCKRTSAFRDPLLSLSIFITFLFYGYGLALSGKTDGQEHENREKGGIHPFYESSMVSGRAGSFTFSGKYLITDITCRDGTKMRIFCKDQDKTAEAGDYIRCRAYVIPAKACPIGFCDSISIIRNDSKNITIWERIKRMNLSVCRRIDRIAGLHLEQGEEAELTCSVAKALLTGNRAWLKKETVESFKSSGIMHLLALSGLHMGIIGIMISRLLYLIPREKYGTLIRYLLTMAMIWSYTAISGLGISTIRAAVFITIRETGKLFFRQSSGESTIAATVLILVSFNPDIIYDIGFQLSFSAVCGIIFLYPATRELYAGHIRPGLLMKLADSAAITVICQLSSGSVALCYFSTFPRFFLISNIFAIPLASVTIYTGCASLLLGNIPFIGGYCVTAMHYSILLMNMIAELFA